MQKINLATQENSKTGPPCSVDVPRDKTQRPNTPVSSKRDSGYLTDGSPAQLHGSSSQFVFDDELGAVGGREVDGFRHIDIPEDDEETAMDDEVFHLSVSSGQSSYPGDRNISDAVDIPAALRELRISDSDEDTDEELENISSTIQHSFSTGSLRERLLGLRFRTSFGRSIGTQTPSPLCRIMEQVLTLQPEMFRLSVTARGTVSGSVRQRHRSEGENLNRDAQYGPLPDIIPICRDRSSSLPDMPSRRRASEIEFGRELRRISDEFVLSYRGRHLGTVPEGQAASFPGTTRQYWQQLCYGVRQLLNHSPFSRSTSPASPYQ